MNTNKIYYLFILFFVLPFLLIQQTGCAKEYSFEGSDSALVNDTTLLHDTTVMLDSIQNPVVKDSSACSLCRETDTIELGTWSFKNGHSYFCGVSDNAGFIGTNTTFTFFGPSACSVDTGLVITIYLPVEFKQDEYDVSASSVAFYYYSRGTKDMFISKSPARFSATIQSYISATRIATGFFGGTVYKPNGDTTYIRNGRFKVKLK